MLQLRRVLALVLFCSVCGQQALADPSSGDGPGLLRPSLHAVQPLTPAA